MWFSTEFLNIVRNDHACLDARDHIMFTLHCSVTEKLQLVTKLFRNETQNDVPACISFFFCKKIFNSGNMAKELTYVNL